METTTKTFLTIGDCRALLGSSRSFVYKLIADGLPTYKLGRRTFIKSNDLAALYKLQRKRPPRPQPSIQFRKKQVYPKPKKKRPSSKVLRWIGKFLAFLKLLATMYFKVIKD